MRAATQSGASSGTCLFVSRIAVGDAEKAKAEGRCGSSFEALNATGGAPGSVPKGEWRRPAQLCVERLVHSPTTAIVALLLGTALGGTEAN